MAAAARACGRPPQAVRLVVACKHQPAAALAELWRAGARDFADNLAQQLLAHRRDLDASGHPARWHFVGRLQGNKAAAVARAADVVHSLDRASLLPRLAAHGRAAPLPVLLQVNLAEQPQRGGVAPAGLPRLHAQLLATPALEAVGLMAVPPDDTPAGPWFARLAELARQLRWRRAPELSMGMSDDWPAAVAAGATTVRVGRALFGPRADAADAVGAAGR